MPKYELREGFFGKYKLYVEEKFFDGRDPYDKTVYKHMREATKHERREFNAMMNKKKICGVL